MDDGSMTAGRIATRSRSITDREVRRSGGSPAGSFAACDVADLVAHLAADRLEEGVDGRPAPPRPPARPGRRAGSGRNPRPRSPSEPLGGEPEPDPLDPARVVDPATFGRHDEDSRRVDGRPTRRRRPVGRSLHAIHDNGAPVDKASRGKLGRTGRPARIDAEDPNEDAPAAGRVARRRRAREPVAIGSKAVELDPIDRRRRRPGSGTRAERAGPIPRPGNGDRRGARRVAGLERHARPA